MNNLFEPLFVVLALIAATIMGFAIQRGATCSVAAVEGIILHRSAERLFAMIEAAIWVAVALGFAERFHLLNQLPGGYAVTIWTVIGGIILGLGAYINGACVIGAIARIGSGQWVYLLTPIGFFLGCISMEAIVGTPTYTATPSAATMKFATSFALWPLAALLLYRVYHLFFGKNKLNQFRQTAWSPHIATIVIGFTFFLTVLFSGKWAYTEVLSDLAHGMAENLTVRILLVIVLFIGAIVGGYATGKWSPTPIKLKIAVRCLIGSMMMAWGSMLIPGGNDGLILIGMPLLWPYAWIAFLTMCLTIGAALFVQRSFSSKK